MLHLSSIRPHQGKQILGLEYRNCHGRPKLKTKPESVLFVSLKVVKKSCLLVLVPSSESFFCALPFEAFVELVAFTGVPLGFFGVRGVPPYLMVRARLIDEGPTARSSCLLGMSS